MKYKVGDKVRIKSKEWYEDNKDSQGNITTLATFTQEMAVFCGRKANIVEVDGGIYRLDIDNGSFFWDDEMVVQPEKPIISADLLKDIAEIVKTHNLGVSISEQEGKLIVEPLKVEEDSPIGTPVICSNNKDYWAVGIYQGFGRVSVNVNGKDQPEKRLYIIPYNLFNAKNIEESLKYNIVKK